MRLFPTTLALILAALLIGGCEKKDEVPSYVGRWDFVSAEPPFEADYSASYFTVDRKWNFLIYDSVLDMTVEGTRDHFSQDGTRVVLVPDARYGSRSYIVTLKYLKSGRMVVETDSVNGILTTLIFKRDPDSY